MSEKKRLIVIGGGFGGISFVKSLKNENVEIVYKKSDSKTQV